MTGDVLSLAVDAVAGDAAIRGAVIASARPDFPLGAGPALVDAFLERSPDELWTLMTGRCGPS
ncbi:MAG: hypothetical protein IT545_13635 [Rhodobacteraceae bacterium]|nr:hypothetical protein [Paracoccaceae bacterium]